MTGTPRIPRGDAALPEASASEKADLRRTLLAARRAIDPALRAEWDAALGSRLLNWWRSSAQPALGVYWPLRGEPDLSATYAALAASGAELCLPMVATPNAPLVFAAWTPGEAMDKDEMGVPVPADVRIVPAPLALLVPCLGFNSGRFRLGYGGGYYDRTLVQYPRPYTVGIAYACMAASFGNAAHDIAMDMILTETGRP
jgi:5-formyltetrahydrofolate cyclo-ligase